MPLAHIIPRRRGAPPLLISPVLLLLPLMQAFADADDSGQSRAQSLDPVLVTAQALRGPQSAPSQGSLVATQPQSIVGADFIRNNDAPAANYTDIIKFTPSVWTVDPNGPGLMENLGTSIRGFQDGQFNLTLDGIPWGDSNDFTHHSTSYFMSQDLGNVVVDRGPGNAATIGDATFGGTRAFLSVKNLSILDPEPAVRGPSLQDHGQLVRLCAVVEGFPRAEPQRALRRQSGAQHPEAAGHDQRAGGNHLGG